MGLFSSITKAVTKPLSSLWGGVTGQSTKTAQINAKPFDLSAEAKPREQFAQQQQQAAQQRSQTAYGQQQALIQQLQQQASGQGPSLANAQLRSASERSLAAQLAAASAGRGGSVAGQQRALAMQQGAAGRDLAAQSAEARMAEAMQARQQLAGMLQQEQQLSDTLTANYLQKGYDFATATKLAQQQRELAQAGMQQQTNMIKSQREQALIGGLLSGASSAGGAMLAASDERQKENVSDAKKDAQKFLDALSAKSYNYKDTSVPGTAEGRRFGIMAQDLEKSEMGKSLVRDGADGVKRIDTVQGFGAVLAAQAELNKRLKALERKKRA